MGGGGSKGGSIGGTIVVALSSLSLSASDGGTFVVALSSSSSSASDGSTSIVPAKILIAEEDDVHRRVKVREGGGHT